MLLINKNVFFVLNELLLNLSHLIFIEVLNILPFLFLNKSMSETKLKEELLLLFALHYYLRRMPFLHFCLHNCHWQIRLEWSPVSVHLS